MTLEGILSKSLVRFLSVVNKGRLSQTFLTSNLKPVCKKET